MRSDHQLVSCDFLLVVSGGVDGGKGRRSVYDKKFQFTPKTTEQHLIARSGKSVAYLTNNRRLCLTCCTVEANYWRTRSVTRPLCDSRATRHSSVLSTTESSVNLQWRDDQRSHETKNVLLVSTLPCENQCRPVELWRLTDTISDWLNIICDQEGVLLWS